MGVKTFDRMMEGKRVVTTYYSTVHTFSLEADAAVFKFTDNASMDEADGEVIRRDTLPTEVTVQLADDSFYKGNLYVTEGGDLGYMYAWQKRDKSYNMRASDAKAIRPMLERAVAFHLSAEGKRQTVDQTLVENDREIEALEKQLALLREQNESILALTAEEA